MLKKWCQRLIISLLIASLLVVLGAMAWIWQPYDKTAWRVKLPIGSGIQVRVLPMLMLATSPAGRWLLDKKGFSLHHGDIRLMTLMVCAYIASIAGSKPSLSVINH